MKLKPFVVKRLLTILLCFAFILRTNAQGDAQNKNKFIRKLQKTVWTVGLSGTVIADAGSQFKKLFDVANKWDYLYFPSKVNVEGAIDKGFSVEGCFTYSQLKAGKLLGDKNIPRPASANLYAFDVNAKYDLNEVIGDTKFFSPYAISGLGFTVRTYPERKSAITFNIGFGFNVWLYKGFGLNAQTMGKFAINSAFGKNYLQHSVGIVYRFNLLTGYKTPNRLGHRYNLFREL